MTMKTVHISTLGLMTLCLVPLRCLGFAHTTKILNLQRPCFKRNDGCGNVLSSSSLRSASPVVNFVDPETQARVSLLGVFHGTLSSAQDVQSVMAEANTDVVVLELCASRFSDLQQEQERLHLEAASNSSWPQRRSWPVRYVEMIIQTVRTKGLPTGLAAALLGGFSGLQSAMSGFVPGLEFTTALELCMQEDKLSGYESSDVGSSGIDIVLADQAVDETLRKLGGFAGTASDIFLWERQPGGQRTRRTFSSALHECNLHLDALQCAVFGKDNNGQDLPQVNLPSVLLRNSAAVQDLVRLALPSTLLIAIISQLFATMLGEPNEPEAIIDDISRFSQFMQAPLISIDLILEWSAHALVSGFIIGSGALAAIPVVKTILTERDEILTSGIRTACRRAGKNGRVVAVLGLLHVNGVARRMLDVDESSVSTETNVMATAQMQQ